MAAPDRHKVFMRILAVLFGVFLLSSLAGWLLFPRPELPALVTEDYCARYNIQFDATSLQSIYLDPQSILADSQGFLDSDPASQLLAHSRVYGGQLFVFDAWLDQVERLASYPLEKRQGQTPYRLFQLILAHQQAFCQQVGSHVLAYLPEGAESGVTIYLTAIDDPWPAYFKDRAIVFSLSHPLFLYATIINAPTGLSTFFNLGLQELFHVGFAASYPWPALEEHKQNEVVIDILINLQNEGIATYIEHQLSAQFPSPFEWFLYLVDQRSVVRWYIAELNELLAVAQTMPVGDAYADIYRRIGILGYNRKGFNIVGAYMAAEIEHQLGRQALIQTIQDGYQSFPETYNAIAEQDMQIQWSMP